ncbi:hypothetical protein [Iningainema tapete]|uniref:Uncharacterized protein n=1 Tax=Iningainema tapete BLCC-T55 TaxID=2748662 RepID=A0A8J6Y0W3_9CYAN|nr:hypothetical protein [Iningainema tapete]MBD2777118.1 hypothetical protein [Iningainema tapete BLCC-T55]
MLRTVWATVREGKIELLENVPLTNGAKVLVTVLAQEDEQQFWLKVSEQSVHNVWDNTEDDIYGELLQK